VLFWKACSSSILAHCTMKDYAQFLVRRFAVPHFCKSVTEVHIVLDSPGQNLRTPKAFEQCRRDAKHSVSPDHEHFQFTDVAGVPRKWHDHLNCRHCKRLSYQPKFGCLGCSLASSFSLNPFPALCHFKIPLVYNNMYK